MKLFTDETRLRMVGKAWQIRAKCKELSRSPITLQQFLLTGKRKKILKNYK